MAYSPILFFTYNRLKETQASISALQANIDAKKSMIFIFSDAPNNKNAEVAVNSVRQYLRTIKGFKSINIIEREKNLGLAKSIISGISDIIQEFGSVIILEDDLITSNNFLLYMNQALEKYKNNPKVWSVSGFSFPMVYPQGYDFDAAFGIRASSWGWATWKERWNKVDWSVSDYRHFCKDRAAQKEFNYGGSDMCKMLKDQMTGKIDSWAIRFCYAQYKHKAYDLFPVKSKIQSIGFSEDASNTKGMAHRFATEIDTTGKNEFRLPDEANVKESILAQFRKRFSISTRLKYRFLRMWK